jgi:hypothetical protein
MANSLLKTAAHNSFADGIYKEILSRSTRYYYFVGKTLNWLDEATPPVVIDSRAYEKDCRNEIIAFKEIAPSDISYVVPRVNWITGIVYDVYDDQYSSEIQGIDLVSGGSLYPSAPTITIGDVVPTSLDILANRQYFYNGSLYTVKTGGTTGPSNSVLLGVIGTDYAHGGTVLTCVGVQATATCTVGTSGVNNQKIISITMVNRGYGYTIIPSVNFSSGSAGAIAVITNGVSGGQRIEDTNYYVQYGYNIYVCINNNDRALSTVAPTGISSDYLTTADGYTWKYMSSIPASSKFLTSNYMPVYTANQNQYSANGSIINIFIDNPGDGYLSASEELPLNTAVVTGQNYYHYGYIYTVTVSGTTGGTYPGTTVGSTYILGTASVVCNLATTITVNGDGIDASLTPLISGGKLTGVQINNAGTGYSYTNFTVVGSGYGANISATIYTGIQQYSNQAQIEVSTISGNICSIQVISGGYNYASPSIAIVGDGVGATATAIVINGHISNINIVNRGSNYNWANVVITDTTGAGALARVVPSPFGGLGKDTINHLYAKSLMFYSKLSDNTNQGLTVTNDYRQVGIIKDPIRYKDSTNLTSNFSSTCWKVTATAIINPSILVDDIVTTNSNSITYRFRVISITSADILLIPLDNGIPSSGMQFIKSSGIYFIASSVTPPTVDKYSGDLLFIDNEASFVATSGAAAILRTVINF